MQTRLDANVLIINLPVRNRIKEGNVLHLTHNGRRGILPLGPSIGCLLRRGKFKRHLSVRGSVGVESIGNIDTLPSSGKRSRR
jgi:hypothetical protein